MYRWNTKELVTIPLIILIVVQVTGNAMAYTTYYMDHQVSEKQARISIREEYNRTRIAGEPNWCSTFECTEEINNYCLGIHLIQDHCCCDQAHRKETMPWLPHECYMGQDICKPIASSCMDYMHRRQCCCDRLLIEMLHYEYSTAIKLQPTLLFILLPTIVMLMLALQSFKD